MATRTWLGADGNWANTANWSGGAVPVDGDDVVIDSGSVSITTGMNQSGISLKSLNITRGYTGSIGTAGDPLLINVDHASATACRIAMNRGYLYVNGSMTVPFRVDQCSGAGGVVLSGGTLAGTPAIVCGEVGTLRVTSGVTVSGDVITCGIGLMLEAAVSGSVYMYRGTHAAYANIGTLVLGASATLTTKTTAAITTGTLHGQANHVHDSSGTIGTLNALPGSYHKPGGSKDYTITTLNRYAGSNVTTSVTGATVTVGTDNPYGEK